jgi:SAM-dependent methyltransferase
MTSSEIARCGISNAKLLLMDARKMEFADSSFDFVTAGFVGWSGSYDFKSFKFKRRARGLEEITRVLKQGGKAGFTGWTIQEDSDLVKELVRTHLQESPSRVKRNTRSVRDAYSRETPEGWRNLLSALGFEAVRIKEETREITYADEEEWWKAILDAGWREEIRRLGGKTIQSGLRRDTSRALADHRDDRGIHFRRSVVYALGTK